MFDGRDDRFDGRNDGYDNGWSRSNEESHDPVNVIDFTTISENNRDCDKRINFVMMDENSIRHETGNAHDNGNAYASSNENGSKEEEIKYEVYREDIPRWQPDVIKYNTQEPPKKKDKKTKKKRNWGMPVIIALLCVLTITCGALVFQVVRLTKEVNGYASNGTNVTQGTIQNTNEDLNNPSVGNGSLTDISKIVENTMPAVVSITSRTIANNGSYWDFFFGGFGQNTDNQQQEEVDSGIGSGTIVDITDYEIKILTSYHVVKDSSSLYVTFNDGTSVDGVIKSASEENDIAVVSVPVLDVPEDTLNAIKVAKLSADPVSVGEGVIVIGNALGYGQSVVTGIVSATGREINVDGKALNVIQTDAAINNGNSGGCMLNSKGEVVGISEAKITVTAVEGMCYAIPIHENLELINQLLNAETGQGIQNDNDTQSSGGAFLGIRGQDVTAEIARAYNRPMGIYVGSVIPGSGAEEAGIKEGDVITAIDGKDVTTMQALQSELANYYAGAKVEIKLYRLSGQEYKTIELEVTLTDPIS